MKKLSTIISFAVLFILASCQKESVTIDSIVSNPLHKVSVNDGMLYFETEDDYQNTIDYLSDMDEEGFLNWENEISFISMRSEFEEDELKKMGVVDNLLATLLNPEGVIRIGENIFKLDIPNETVYTVPASKYTKDFYTEKSVKTYSTEDDVLGILDGTTNALEKGNFCPGNKQKIKYWYPPSPHPKVKCKVVYQRAGIYYSLQAKIKKVNAWGGDVQIGYSTQGSNFWRNKKTSDTFSCSNQGFGHEYTCRPYSSTRRLKAYRYSVYFWAEVDYTVEGGYYWFEDDTLTITCS